MECHHFNIHSSQIKTTTKCKKYLLTWHGLKMSVLRELHILSTQSLRFASSSHRFLGGSVSASHLESVAQDVTIIKLNKAYHRYNLRKPYYTFWRMMYLK